MNAALAVQPPDCARCGDARRVWNRFLKKMIRCPACTVRARPRDPVTMERINAMLVKNERNSLAPVEVRRIVSIVDRQLAEAVADTFRHIAMPLHLVATDRVLQRWAAAPTGSMAPDTDVYFECRAVPLDPITQEIVSELVRNQPRGVRGFVFDWYLRTWLSVKQMAVDRHMSRRQIHREWHDVLHVMRAKFSESTHVDLVKLVRQSP